MRLMIGTLLRLVALLLLLHLQQHAVHAASSPSSIKTSLKKIIKSRRIARKLKVQPRMKPSAEDITQQQKRVLQLRGGLSLSDVKPQLTLTASKLLLQMLLTMFNVLCWAIPLRTKRFSTNQDILSIANSFAGGIFLMLSVGHLLPESIEIAAHGGHGHHHGHDAAPHHGHGHDDAVKVLSYSLVGFMAMLFVEKVAFNVGHSHSHSTDEDHHHHHHHHHDESNGSSGGVNSAVLLCLAMSIHSFCESAALGLANDFTSAYMMAACVALHQPAESLALLVSFLKSGMSHRNVALWLSGFSTVALIGVGTGIVINGLATPTLESIIMAITAGTFIYVGATEIANEEFEEGSHQQKLVRFLAYASGMGVMAVIGKYSEQWGH